MNYLVVACTLMVCIIVVILVKCGKKGKHQSKFTAVKEKFNFDPKRTLWYRGTSASLESIWANNLPGDSIFSPMNSNYYINVAGLDKNGNIIFSSHWHNHRILSQQIQPLSNVAEIQLSLATNTRSVIPVDAWDGLMYK